MTQNTEQILAERQKTHGEFHSHAFIAQSIKDEMRSTAAWARLIPPQQEALEMIAHKIARILNGNAYHLDHWDDIAGYATLVSKYLEKSANEDII